MTCHSGGTLEIYVEPHLPAPQLWVVGTTPIAGALARLGAAAGWRVTVIDPIAEPDAFPGADGSTPRPTSVGSIPRPSPYVVVASQGIWDEEAVGLALTRDAAYVGLVASPTRAGVVREWLREETTIGDERIAALRAPAGLDLGRRDGRGDRAVDPGRAGPGATRPGGLRGVARSGDRRRRAAGAPSPSSPSSTTSCSSTRSAG